MNQTILQQLLVSFNYLGDDQLTNRLALYRRAEAYFGPKSHDFVF